MVISSPADLVFDDVFLELREVLPHAPVFVKLEGFSLSGSIKVKPALRMVERLELEGRLGPGKALVESSSGNLGLALAMVCASKGYPFTCISDPNISPQTAKLIRAYGARLVIVDQRDRNGGYLGSRIALIEHLLAEDPHLVWTNQYGNINNVEAHMLSTGPAILRQFPHPDLVFVGAGTTGTLAGVSRYLREHSPHTQVVAVDSVGSVTFGHPSGPRHIPGLGTSQPPEIRRHCCHDQLLMVPEEEAVAMCQKLARRGILLGGSSGTVLAGVRRHARHIAPNACVVAIAPDLGDRYVDTLYNPEWVQRHFPQLRTAHPVAAAESCA
ncbi:2,3-diaminopropionate biosynthesis protein SbnA [Pseudomonas entomophila]|uniref:cysteine synthase n=2 Tax=Pseudomonas entomophila TaxID=312306 RepID=Q1IBI7_PSEE4|nr:2,3-diaminopropionate biosynthesis protein SbnA [Pseudomonas entomophila]WMW04236.1 2,3-diaminopropionate biosynthesis protein SbnA [Pseudomonas entomophila]CAK14978.1 putative Cysteine synthase [Pseudomonas entomophila L48]